MGKGFVVPAKKSKEKTGNQWVVTTIRMEHALCEAYDKLANESKRSRNEVMCMALRYALDNLELTPEERL